MAEKLSDKIVRALTPPADGSKITYDEDVKGFGVRVTSAGAKAFVLNYRAAGRERRITIGSYPDWKVSAARDHAKGLKREIDDGGDPMADRHADRVAPTIDSLADRFSAEHLSKRRAATRDGYERILRLHIRPALGKVRVTDLRHADCERLHRAVAKSAPYQANRTIAVLSKMLSLAIRWEMRADNPCKGVERAPEDRRERYLSPAEIGRLADALAAHPERASANAIRLLLLTGARRGEVLAAQWAQFDLETGVWTKAAHQTKQAKLHRVPLGAAARALLAEMRGEAVAGCPFLFPTSRTPSKGPDGRPLWTHQRELKKTWAAVCKAADVSGARVHDLRHTFASVLASSGLSLPIIGALLGHSQPATTARYAHLSDDPLRVATERAGAVITGAGKPGAEIVPLRRTP